MRLFQHRFFLWTLVGLLVPHTLYPEPYRLVAGDRLEIMHSGLANPRQLTIDADGQIRMTDLGGMDLAGLSLDEAQDALARAMEDAGLYVEPRVNLSISEYAPVVIGGDVMQPGERPFVPGMTVATALALAGGSQMAGMTRSEIARARVEAESGMRISNLDIAAAVAAIARHRAILAGAAVVLDEKLSAHIPNLRGVDMTGLLENEEKILENSRQKHVELELFWDREISTITEQVNLFDERLSVQHEIVASAAEALENMRVLQEKGLQTSTRLQTAEQRDADARNRVLELESAKIAATRAIADAERARVQFRAGVREDALVGEREASLDMAAAELRHARFAAQAALLSGGAYALAEDAVIVSFSILSPRADRGPISVSRETLILPGDTLMVSVTPTGAGPDG